MAHALIYYIGLPIALFAVISAVVLLSTTDRKKFKVASDLTRIE
jgi:uncharacterized membrane protein YgaE (UPF0421/DUF939 family)